MAYTDKNKVREIERRVTELIADVDDAGEDGVQVVRDRLPKIFSDLTTYYEEDIAARHRAARGERIIPIDHPAWQMSNDAKGLTDSLRFAERLIGRHKNEYGDECYADIPSSLGWLLRTMQMLERIEE